jgi:hypothetical protein
MAALGMVNNKNSAHGQYQVPRKKKSFFTAFNCSIPWHLPTTLMPESLDTMIFVLTDGQITIPHAHTQYIHVWG